MSRKEQYEHVDCPKCGTPSNPGENVPDQSLRCCPNCFHEWWEDFNRPPRKGTWDEEDTY